MYGIGKIPQHLGTYDRSDGKETAKKQIIARQERWKCQLHGK